MKKSLVSLLLLVAMMFNIFAMLTSCFGPGGYEEQTYDGAYDGSSVTISFWHSMGAENKALLDSAIARFNEIYPNIKVEHQSYGDYDGVFDVIRTKLTAGKQPSFAFCYPDHVATYNKSESVICLDDLINNKNVLESGEMMGFTDAQIADFIPAYYNEGKEYGDGKMYSIAFQKSTEVLYYNKTIVDPIMAKLNIDTLDTWDKVELVIQELKTQYPMSTPLGYDSSENFFITLSIQNDAPYTSANGEHYLFDNDKSKAFVAKFAEWYQKGWMTTSELMGGSYTSDAFKKGNDESGKVFMSIGSSAGARYQRPDKVNGKYPFEVGIVSIPQTGESKKVISQGPSVCIFEPASGNAQEVYASWLLVKFLTTDARFQAEYSMKSGYVPVIQSVYETKQYQDSLAKADGGNFITALAAKVALEQKDYYFTSPAFPGSADARTQVGLLVEAVFTKYQLNGDNTSMLNEQFKKFYDICKAND